MTDKAAAIRKLEAQGLIVTGCGEAETAENPDSGNGTEAGKGTEADTGGEGQNGNA